MYDNTTELNTIVECNNIVNAQLLNQIKESCQSKKK